MNKNRNTYKIIIETQDGVEPSGNAGVSSGGRSPSAPRGKKPKVSNNGVVINGALLLGVAKRSLSFATNSIEMYTGNSVVQQKVLEGAGAIAWLGAMATRPALTLAFSAVTVATNALTKTNNAMWENRRAEQMARRSGNYLSTSTR